MTREGAKEWLPIIQAWAEGKPIQYQIDSRWIDITKDIYTSNCPYNYRIKSEIKYRPFKDQEECWNEMLKHQPFGWIKDREGQYRHVMSVKDESDFAMWFANYIFIDGIPFGIKDE